ARAGDRNPLAVDCEAGRMRQRQMGDERPSSHDTQGEHEVLILAGDEQREPILLEVLPESAAYFVLKQRGIRISCAVPEDADLPGISPCGVVLLPSAGAMALLHIHRFVSHAFIAPQ